VDTPRHRRTPRRPLRGALAALQGLALGGLLTLVVVGGLDPTAPSAHPGITAEADASQGVVQQAVADHHCSYAGFHSATPPASALIRNARGELRQVTFKVGWAVYNHKLPGTLVAVCLDETRGNELVQVSNQDSPS
jgi:hypothetical protein